MMTESERTYQQHKHKYANFTERRSVFSSLRLKAILAIVGLILAFPLVLNVHVGVSLVTSSSETQLASLPQNNEPYNKPNKKVESWKETVSWNNNTTLLKPMKKGKVMFHMGVHKTGSTSIQNALNLQAFQDSLMEDNFIVGNVDGSGYGTKSALAKCFKNKQSCSSRSSQTTSAFVKRIEEALVGNHNLVLSSEQFDYFRKAKKIKRFFHEFDDVQVILFYRRFFEWILSMYMQNKRNGWMKSWARGDSGNRKNFVTFLASRNISSYVIKEPRYTVSAYKYYKKHFNVSLVNMHAGTGDSLTNFLCSPVLNTPRTCRKRQRNELQVGRSNQVSGREVYDEIAMAAYAGGLVDVEKYSRGTARRMIQEHQESYLNRTATDFPLICPPMHQLNELLEVSIKVEREYFPDFFEAEQEDKLREKFHKMVSRSQFCSVDTKKVLDDPQWKTYFLQW